MRASYYARYGELIVSATSTLNAPDAMDDLRRQVLRGFAEAIDLTGDYELEDDATEAAPDPGTVDTTNLPPID